MMKHLFYKYVFLLLYLLALSINARQDLGLTYKELYIYAKARFKRNVTMDKKLQVHGKAYFHDDVHFKDDVKINKSLTVKGGVVVEDDLSAQDIVIVSATIANLSVTDTLITNSHSVLDE